MIDTLYRQLLLPPVRLLTRGDAEIAHEWYLRAMRRVNRKRAVARIARGSWAPDPILRQTLLDGLEFLSPFGVAAGLDKNATIFTALESVSSPGFIEIGTVTPRPQAGNPRPRIVRVGSDGLINAMGFPNEGIEAALTRLSEAPDHHVPLGLNVGKMKETSDEDTPSEYGQLIAATAELRRHRRLPDFYVVNVSSPNTPGLTAMQRIEPLSELLESVTAELDELSNPDVNLRHRMLVKLGPDLSESQLTEIIDVVIRLDIGGIILTNTTVTRPVHSRHDERPGGFSGSALFDRSARSVRVAAGLMPRHKVLVAAGGIDTVDRAFEMLRYADLVGGYTGLMLQGPHLFRRLADGVAARMHALGVKELRELREDQRPA